jgi:hypothetical protein
MKKSVICLALIASCFIITLASINSWADGSINIVNYSLKPVGYVENEKYLQTMYSVEFKNSDGAPHSFNFKVVFYDKEKNEVKESLKKIDIQANETKKLTDAVLVDAAVAGKVASTKGFVENIQ